MRQRALELTPPPICAGCGSALERSALACPQCGRLSPRRALSLEPGCAPALICALGAAMGLAVWVPLGLVAEFGVPALVTPPGYHGVLPLAARATILVLQALPLTVGLIAGTSLVRRGRLGLGWFLIVTGICATAPAAACDLAGFGNGF